VLVSSSSANATSAVAAPPDQCDDPVGLDGAARAPVMAGGNEGAASMKWRATAAELDLSIDAWRLRRVAAAAEAVAHRYLRRGDSPRIDALMLAPGCWPRHIVNAWQP